MPIFRRKPDPIAESERQLQSELASLQREIRELQHKIDSGEPDPPPSAAEVAGGRSRPLDGRTPEAPTFEQMGQLQARDPFHRKDAPGHYNELGVRKYDPVANLRRWWSQLRGTPAANPRLVSYLAAGSIHGLRPLRYEKRVARNRFLALCAFFVAILCGLIYFYLRNR